MKIERKYMAHYLNAAFAYMKKYLDDPVLLEQKPVLQ